jgi:hypothetical protein
MSPQPDRVVPSEQLALDAPAPSALARLQEQAEQFVRASKAVRRCGRTGRTGTSSCSCVTSKL